jgi:hypothetical protein
MNHKKVGMDICPLEQFYAIPDNTNKLYQPDDCTGDQNVTLPCLLVIPPHFIEFYIKYQCTPFQFNKFIAMAAVATIGLPIDITE